MAFTQVLPLFAIVALAAAHDGSLRLTQDQRPTGEEWEKKKADEKAAKDGVAANDAKMAAVNKVVDLLESLQKDILAEGEKEAATYNKFACFCKDTMTEKSEAIQKGEDEDERLTFAINDLSSQRDVLDGTIAEIEEKIKTAEAEMKETREAHHEALALYTKNEADLADAIKSLNGAIKAMKASKNPSLLQMQTIGKTVRSAVLMAEVLGIGSQSAQQSVAVFLQQAPVPMQDYDFHGGDIIETLEQLLKDFTDEKSELDRQEVQRVAEYDSFKQEHTDYIKKKNVMLDTARKDRENTIAQIASDSQELSTVAATLLDDKEYLKELSQMCSDKAKTWDQRVGVRADELQALTAAIGIIKGGVSEKTSAATVRLAQEGVSVRLADAMAHSESAMEADEAAAEAGEAPQFVQVAASRPALNDAGRQAIVLLLRGKGEQFKSTLLTSLASTIASTMGADPFAKIKQLIQDLIDRLLTESANESNQKGWCDKATADAEQKRDYAADDVKELNGRMANLEATRDKLAEELEVLAAEIKDLRLRRSEADEERTEEKAENEATVDEAGEGQAFVESAIDLLDKFYKTAAKSEVDLSLAQGPADDMPDAGFEIGEAYTGAQGKAGGILGMLDVIRSDFVRTIKETEKAETKAAKDFLNFMTETGKSLAVKTMASEQKTSQKDATTAELEDARESLQARAKILRSSIAELLELKPVCVDTGMSYEERVARREDEIQALNKALCILKAYAEYGADGIGDKC